MKVSFTTLDLTPIIIIAANRKDKLLEGLGLKRDKLSIGNNNTYQSPHQRVFELSELLAHLTVLVRFKFTCDVRL